jgi:hypothetical protein
LDQGIACDQLPDKVVIGQLPAGDNGPFESKRMCRQICTDSAPSHDDAGDDEPPFASLLCCKQTQHRRQYDRSKTNWISPILKWWNEDASEQNRASHS